MIHCTRQTWTTIIIMSMILVSKHLVIKTPLRSHGASLISALPQIRAEEGAPVKRMALGDVPSCMSRYYFGHTPVSRRFVLRGFPYDNFNFYHIASASFDSNHSPSRPDVSAGIGRRAIPQFACYGAPWRAFRCLPPASPLPPMRSIS